MNQLKKYIPIIAVFSTSVLLSLATNPSFMTFMGYFLTILSLLKFMDLAAFKKGFEQYDLIAMRHGSYSYVFPVIEGLTGLGLLSKMAPATTAFFAILIGLAGGISVIKTVYVDKKKVSCACVGGKTAVPLGFVTLLENATMVLAGALVFL